MARARKPWSTDVTAHGDTVMVFERRVGGSLYMATKGERRQSEAGKAYTAKLVKAIRPATTDRTLADAVAREWCQELATERLTGAAPRPGRLTFGELERLYTLHQFPLKTEKRQAVLRTALRLFRMHLTPDFPIADFGAHHAQTYVAARLGGAVRSPDRRARDSVREGTIRNELHILNTVCAWAGGYRVNGQPLLPYNPLRSPDVKKHIPTEDNPCRPIVRVDRYRALAAVALEVDPSGAFGMMLDVAWFTGRRINAILHLRASDVLTGHDAVVRAFAEDGQDEEIARAWPSALRWRAEFDKKGYLTFCPMPAALTAALAAYVRRRGIIGDGWLFPAPADATKATNVARAGYLLEQAEIAAKLPHMRRGGWHAMRRGWATLRKSLPVQDVMVAGGWRDAEALRTAYQGADSQTVLDVVNIAV
jgi:integrase